MAKTAEFLAQVQHCQDLATVQSIQNEFLTQGVHCVFENIPLPEPLKDACQYAMSNGGKRVRPLLVLATALSVAKVCDEVILNAVYRAMLAVEMIHGYSLIHDDLPCMDDDDLRRGKPTCHVVYGEATALLAGDALQSLAFETLVSEQLPWQIQPTQAASLLVILAPCARRMVAGQMLDIEGEKRALAQEELEAIHRDKTGALIEASVLMGGFCAQADTATMAKLLAYAQAIGLAFQVQDDVLDVVSDTQTLGKPSGSDVKLDKSTYVQLLGVQGAKDYANQLFAQAKTLAESFGADNLLVQVVSWLQKRNF